MIEWDWATSASDASELGAFICTEPAPATLGENGDILELEAPWEFEAQAGLQNAACPSPVGERILIGRDGLGIAAACWWGETNPRMVRLYCIGVALRLRRRGLHVGDQLMTEVLDRIDADALESGVDMLLVDALVDRSNGDSQALLTRHGFTYMNNDGWYQRWFLRIDYSEG